MKHLKFSLTILFLCMASLVCHAVTIKVGGSTTLTGPTPGSSRGALYTWSPTYSSYVSMMPSSSGSTCKVTGEKAGSVTISCTVKWQTYDSTTGTYVYASSNKKTQTYSVTVQAADNTTPTSISLNYTSVSLNVGSTKQLSATVSPSGASQSVSWSVVSGSSYASVSSSGLVTALATGTATIRATSSANSSVYANCTVTVTAATLNPGTWSGNTLTIGGNATSSTNRAPYNNYWTYSTTQMLYSPAEIGKSGTINSIAFKVASASSFTPTALKVYLGHKSSIFSNTSDYVASSSLTLVYDGTPTLGASTGWETLTFNKGTFDYNGTDNLVVVVAMKSSNYNTSLKYYYYTGSGYVLSRGSDSATGYGDITNTSAYSTSTERPSIRLGFGQSQSGTTNIEINATNFPDANFRSYLLSQSYGSDGILTQDEINGVTSFSIGSRQISSLKGIEHFTALKTLWCNSNQLTTLDVSKNTALTALLCISNQLTTLDVSKNTALKTLWCGSNQLTMLDVSKNTALKNLSCSSNQLTTLDVSKNTALTELYCYSNQLTTLDVSGNTALELLQCYKNNINGVNMDNLIAGLRQNNTNSSYEFSVIYPSASNEGNVCTKAQVAAVKAKGWTPYYYDGSKYYEYEGSDESQSGTTNIEINATNFPDANFRSYLLSKIYGSDGILTQDEINGVTSFSISFSRISSLKGIEHFTALTYLDCYSNQLTTLDVSKNTALTYLHCSSNQLTTLDVSKNTALTELYCNSNQLTTLDVSKNTALKTLWCDSNQLTTLDVSKNTALKTLWCDSNQLTTLDVSKNTALTELYCYSNQLTTLDVSKNTALKNLSCDSNRLATLDVSKNTALTGLYCGENQLTTLDVSKNTALTELYCYSNQLTTLDVSGNTALELLQCYKNNINGVNMDNLIAGLRQNNTNTSYKFRVIYPSASDEGNVCTKAQVAAVKAKGWTPYYYDGSKYYEYEGSEDDGDTFTATTVEGVAMTFKVISAADKTCQTQDLSYDAQGTITIPEEVLGFRVIGIGSQTFSFCRGLTSINIPNSVTSIGWSAFNDCSSLTSITLPNSVTSIGHGAFENCTGLTSITIPNSVTDIEYGAFWGCTGLSSVNIGSNVKNIGWAAFRGCSSLTSITIPSSVTSIKHSVFENCDNLSSIKVEAGNTVYDSRNNCNAIIETATNTIIAGCKNSTIPNTITCIGESAFENCSGLASITFPESVTTIGESAFTGCSGLTSIVFPNSVIYIDEDAFENCSNLATITVPNSVTSIGRDAFDRTLWYDNQPDGLIYAGKVLYKYKGTMQEGTQITIEEGTLGIAGGAFYDCCGLISIIMPNSLTNIGELAFAHCTGFTSITIGSGVTTVGYEAFDGCSNLASITIPESVIYMENNPFRETPWFENQPDGVVYAGKVLCDYKGNMPEGTHIDIMEGTLGIAGFAFEKCGDLTSFTIPNSVKAIGYEAFPFLHSLTAVTSYIKAPKDASHAFGKIPTGATLYVPYGTKVLYEATGGWNQFTNIVEIEEEPNETIEVDGLYYEIANSDVINAAIGQEVLPSNADVAVVVEAPRWHQYHGDIVIPASITYENNTYAVVAIDECAFAEYKKTVLNSVVIPNSVVYIAEEAFVESSTLERVEIPNSVRYIGEDAFADCESLSEIVSYLQKPFEIQTNVFRNITNDATLYVPYGTKVLYEATSGWNQFTNIVEMEEKVMDISQLDNAIYIIESYEGVRSGRMNLSVRIKNSVTAEGFDFDLILPIGFSVAYTPEGKIDAELSGERADESTLRLLEPELSADGRSLHISASPANKDAFISGNDGEVMIVGVMVDANVSIGEHSVTVMDAEIHDREATYPHINKVQSSIIVCDKTLGDANGNGNFNGADYTSILHYLWDRPDPSFVMSAADVNCDGYISVSDLTAWIYLYLNRKNATQSAPQKCVPQVRIPE